MFIINHYCYYQKKLTQITPLYITPTISSYKMFGFSRYIVFPMYLDTKCISKYIAKTMYLKKRKRLII